MPGESDKEEYVFLIIVFLSTKHSTEVPHCDQFMSKCKILKYINNL